MAVTAPTPPTPPSAPTAPQVTPVESGNTSGSQPDFGTTTVTQSVQDAKAAAQAAGDTAQHQAADARQSGKSLAADTQQAANTASTARSQSESQQDGKSLPAAAAGDETQSESQQAQPVPAAQAQGSGVPYWGFLVVFAAALLLFLLRDFLQDRKAVPAQRVKLDFTGKKDEGKKPTKSHFEIRI